MNRALPNQRRADGQRNRLQASWVADGRDAAKSRTDRQKSIQPPRVARGHGVCGRQTGLQGVAAFDILAHSGLQPSHLPK